MVDQDHDETAQTAPQPGDGRKPWADPVLVKLEAGEAETGPLYSPDNTFGS
jgi:hypothetical protein